MRLRRLCLIPLALAAFAAAPAQAADRTGTVSASSPSYAWDGGPGSSVGVNLPVIGGASVGNFVGCFESIADCEETLIEVKDAGKLTVTATASDPANDGIDLYLYPSNAEGEYDDSEPDMAEGGGASATGDEKIEAQVSPGYYMALVKFFLADNETYKGAAVLSGFAPPKAPEPAPPPPPQQGEPPQSSPQQSQPAPASSKKSSKAACKRKAKKIKNKKKRKKALRRCAKKSR